MRMPGRYGPCQFASCGRLGTWRRQNTNYTDDADNWACFCAECQTDVDGYWAVMWKDYNSGRL